MLPPNEVEEPQFGGEFLEDEEDEQSLSDIDRFTRMCSHPPQLEFFSEVKPVVCRLHSNHSRQPYSRPSPLGVGG